MIYFGEEIKRNDSNEKIIYTCQLQKQSSIFSSKSKRFEVPFTKNKSPGPGQYNIPDKDIQTTSKYQLKQKNDPILKMQYMWLLENKRFDKSYFKNRSILGPGSYNIQIDNPESQSFTKQQRFKKIASKPSKLGPGSYDVQTNKIIKQRLPSFSKAQRFLNSDQSQSPKRNLVLIKFQNSQFQLYKNRVAENEKIFQQIKLMEKVNKTQAIRKQKQQAMHIFRSNKQRFETRKQQNVGPGYYSLSSNQIMQDIKQRDNLIHKTQVQIKQMNPMQQQSIKTPGPNEYYVNNYNLESILAKKNITISRSTRFNFRQKKSSSTILPGPGDYNKKKYKFIDPQSYVKQHLQLGPKKISHKSNSVSFLSSSNRQYINTNSQGNALNYDISINDIAKRSFKLYQRNEKLRSLDVDIAPFNTHDRRL